MRTFYIRGRTAHPPAAFIIMLLMMVTGSALAQNATDRFGWNASVSVRHAEQLDRRRGDLDFPDRSWNGASAGVQFRTRTERSLFGFFGRAGANVYDAALSDRITYGGGFSWNYRPSSRSNMSLSQAVNKNLRLDTVSDLGILPADLTTTSATTSWRFQQQPSSRTSWNTGLGYRYVKLGSRIPIVPSQVVLDEPPFGNEIDVTTIDTSPPTEIDLPNAEDEVLRILATEGLSDRGTESHFGFASFGLNHSMGRYTTIGFDVNGGYRTIQTSRAGDGPVAGAQAFFKRALNVSSALNVAYTFQRSFVIDPNTTIQSVYGGWSYSNDNSSFTATVLGGASRFSAEGTAARTQPVANVSFSGNPTSSTSASVYYRRQFSMALGFGRSLLMDYTHANLTQRVGSRVTLSANAGASFGSDPVDDTSEVDTRRVGGAATVRMVGGLTLGTNYYYIENRQSGSAFGFVETHSTWSTFLTYNTDF